MDNTNGGKRVTIAYPRHFSNFLFLRDMKLPTVGDIIHDYMPIYYFESTKPDIEICSDAFARFNAENNPLTSDYHQKWLSTSGATHTSMSVGDIIAIDDVLYIVVPTGFRKLVGDEWLTVPS